MNSASPWGVPLLKGRKGECILGRVSSRHHCYRRRERPNYTEESREPLHERSRSNSSKGPNSVEETGERLKYKTS